MSRNALLAALGLLLAVNALVLAGVSYNRSGQPEATLLLTEREAPLAVRDFGREENTGVALQLDWNRGESTYEWFDAGKAAALGFDTSKPPGGDLIYDYYRRQLPRKAFVVLEYGGAAWERFRDGQKKRLAEEEAEFARGRMTREEIDQARARLRGILQADSRLFPVDVGGDPAALRRAWPDRGRCLILPALVRLGYDWELDPATGRRDRPVLHGTIEEILVDHLHLPLPLAAQLPQENVSGPRISPRYRYYGTGVLPTPRYTVLLQVGKRHEPWVAEVGAMEEER